MGILGIVVEYNPFHLGHLHHLAEAKRLVRPEATVAVMSGCFTQRGEPAIVDKWARAAMALHAGVDLVLELPVAWAVRSAPWFASGAVRLLAAAGITDLCFGSECGTVTTLVQAAATLQAEPPLFRQVLQSNLALGRSFATAQGKALQAAVPDLPEDAFAAPNNTLGVHYLLAIRQYALPIRAETIRRTNSYNSEELDQPVPSARAIRRALLAGQAPSGLPDFARDRLLQAMAAGQAPISWPQFELPLLHRLRQLTVQELAGFPETGEGLAARIWQAARQTSRWSELISLVKTRRFPLTKLQRVLAHILLNLRQSDLSLIDDGAAPPYLRVLALNPGNPTVRRLLKQAELPVLFGAKPGRPWPARAERCLALDARATDCYSLAWRDGSRSGLDWTMPVITPRP